MNHLTAEGYAPKDVEMKDCPECDVGSREEVSECCGARIDIDTLMCYECHDHSGIAVCEMCKGTGEIPKTIDDIQDEKDNAAEQQWERDNDK